jgi:integrase
MPRKRRAWSRTIEEAGVSVRIYERSPGSLLAREVRLDGGKDRKSLGHRDKALAEQQARALAQRLAELRYAGHSGPVTLGQLSALYLQHRGKLLAKNRCRGVKSMVTLLERHFGRTFLVDDFSAHQLDDYTAARRSGRLVSARHRLPDVGVHDGTIRNELQLLRTLIAWGRTFRISGRPLVSADPLHRVKLPAEKNAARPIATEARFLELLKVADKAEPTGRFRCLLTLARETGRRINAICQLARPDVLLTVPQMTAALADAGLPVAWADQWPHGAIRWRASSDKLGFESVTPLSKRARAALDAYLSHDHRVGAVPLFPGRGKPLQAIKKEIAGYWLARAEELAELPKQSRGGYHQFRRLFASERRHLPAQDVAAAGGWRSLKVMQDAYQHADAAGVLGAVLNAPVVPPTGPDGHIADTPKPQVSAG